MCIVHGGTALGGAALSLKISRTCLPISCEEAVSVETSEAIVRAANSQPTGTAMPPPVVHIFLEKAFIRSSLDPQLPCHSLVRLQPPSCSHLFFNNSHSSWEEDLSHPAVCPLQAPCPPTRLQWPGRWWRGALGSPSLTA